MKNLKQVNIKEDHKKTLKNNINYRRQKLSAESIVEFEVASCLEKTFAKSFRFKNGQKNQLTK